MYDPRNIVSYGFPLDDTTFTYAINGTTDQASVGKALTLDTSGTSTMKLAGAGDPIHGRLSTLEDRTQQGAGVTGAVQRRFKELLPIKAGLAGLDAVAVGDTVVGAGAGEVKALNDGSAKTHNESINLVVALVTIAGSNFAAVEKL